MSWAANSTGPAGAAPRNEPTPRTMAAATHEADLTFSMAPSSFRHGGCQGFWPRQQPAGLQCSDRFGRLYNGGCMTVSRRGFVGGVAAALGYLKVGSEVDLFAQAQGGGVRNRPMMDEYDAMAHLSSNENCWGPPEPVLKAMSQSFKYAMRYGYPGGDVVGEVAKLHGVKQENVLLTAGSGEVLDVVGTTFLQGGKKVLGVEPSYSSVYQHA